ncbi:hypothetical protein SI65_00214 [Aspergillus cristatus]|uniref:Uncharacterized protein n=1 Tax=Aspergillus cristatus TaxID=573508 RepID=A0A1E3BNT9_ASPCR|nr:hypothetical protein SI65_00214 [Aspergillus cristatus]
MALSELPNELNLYIAGFFEYDGHINVVVQTNRRLHSLLNSYQYKHNLRYYKATALTWAARKGMVSTFQMMLDAGTSPEHTYHEIPCEDVLLHFGPIILAFEYGNDTIVKLLLDKGVDPDPAGWICPVEVQE